MSKICYVLFFLFFVGQLRAQEAANTVRDIKIVSSVAPDASSLKSLVASITKGLNNNDEKAIAIYNYLIFNNYHFAYPVEKDGIAVLKELNVYGWSLCGGLHTLQGALWREMGWDWRYTGWSNPGHTTIEAFYDGKWHYLDVFLKFYAWMPDAAAPGGRTIASQEDIKKNPNIVKDQFVFDSEKEVYYQKDNGYKIINGKANWRAPVFLSCKDNTEGVLKGTSNWSAKGSPTSWSGIKFDEDGYSTDINLAKGFSLDLLWNRIEGAHWWKADRKVAPQHSCSDRDFRNSAAIGLLIEPYREQNKGQGRSFSSGKLGYKLNVNEKALESFVSVENVRVEGKSIVRIDSNKPGWLVLQLKSPYVMSLGSARANDLVDAEISVDEGKTFSAVSLADFSKNIGGAYSCYLKIPVIKELKELDVEIIVQHNCRALPYLAPGENKINVSLLDPSDLKDNSLVITYIFQVGKKSRSFDQYVESDKEIAKSISSEWGPEVYFVQKILKTSDFKNGSFSFDIDIATKKGKYPAYPRMISLKREIVGPGEKPQLLPKDAILFDGSEGEMVSLPYPFHLDLDSLNK